MDIEPLIPVLTDINPAVLEKPTEASIMQMKAIVKVFVIESTEGGWIDCGTGEFSLHGVTSMEGRTSLRIRVEDKPDPNETRESIDPTREKKLKGPSGDPKLLLDVPMNDADDFMRCQSSP
jgi:hypothetical protein